ncbi:MAG: GcrA family cell cycle regulator [Notoacmeibacter sp.]
MNWTDERVELLKKLWGEGLSASQIARQLGGVTRNAVIGKVHRLKLSGRAKTTASPNRAKKISVGVEETQRTRTTAASTAQLRTRPAVMGNTALKTEMLLDGAAEHRYQTSAEANILVMPTSRRLSLVQLGEKTCRWPVGDPMSADFSFCGNEPREASPYCSYHSKLAFQPAAERRRLR